MAQSETSGLVRSGDVDIFYRKFGQPGATPMLIVHGLSYFSYDWIEPATRWAIDREVVAIDMRGFGQSSPSPGSDYKLEAMSRDVLAVMDHLGWQKTILLGHSFGGRVCLATAGWTPARVAGLVMVDFAPDVAPLGRKRTAERIGLQPDVFESIEAAMAYHDCPEVGADHPLRKRYEAFMRKEEKGYVLLRDLAFRDSFKRTMESGQSPPVPQYLWPMFAALDVPAMVIRASESDMFAPETMEKVRAANPKASMIEIDGGHDLAGDNPDGLVAAVRGFLDLNSSEDSGA